MSEIKIAGYRPLGSSDKCKPITKKGPFIVTAQTAQEQNTYRGVDIFSTFIIFDEHASALQNKKHKILMFIEGIKPIELDCFITEDEFGDKWEFQLAHDENE